MPAYLLVVRLPADAVVKAKGRTFHLPAGRYVYVGSYTTFHRPLRHLKGEKRLRWHIDYLLEKGEVEALYLSSSGEEGLAEYLQQFLPAVKGFGSSDSRAKGHLFLLERRGK